MLACILATTSRSVDLPSDEKRVWVRYLPFCVTFACLRLSPQLVHLLANGQRLGTDSLVGDMHSHIR